jgi:hypothetical protein
VKDVAEAVVVKIEAAVVAIVAQVGTAEIAAAMFNLYEILKQFCNENAYKYFIPFICMYYEP